VAAELFKQMQTFKMKFITKVATILFLTAVEKKNYNLAYEIAQYVEQKNPQSNISINLSVIIFFFDQKFIYNFKLIL
jgi:hypothetical protein